MKQGPEDRFDLLKNRLKSIEQSLDGIDTSLAELQEGQEILLRALNTQANNITRTCSSLNSEISGLERSLKQTLSNQHEELRERLTAVETAALKKL